MAQETTIGFFPNELDSPEEKAKESWGLRYAQAIVSAGDRLASSYTDRKDKWEEARKYAQGLQDIDKLKRRAIPTENEWMTLPLNVSTPVPRYIRRIQETIYSHPYKPRVDIFDSHSHSRMERRKNELLGKMQLKAEVDNLKAEGILPNQLEFKQLRDAPKDQHEVEMYLKTNAKTIEQIAIEKLVRRSFSKCNMPQIERSVVKDLTEIQWACVHADLDEDGCFKAEYIDPMLTVTSYVEKDDFSDMVWAGHISYITVGQFREMMPELDNEQILNVIRMNVGNRLHQDYDIRLGSRRYFDLNQEERDGLEGVLIEVLNFETLQSDRVTYVEKELSTGGYDIKRRSADYEGPKDPNAKKKVHKGIVERIYKGVHVMRTDYMLEWGLKPSVAYKLRKGKVIHKPCFSYIFRAPNILDMQNKSLMEEVIPHIDKMLILEIKALHFLALATPPGFSYDISAIVEAVKGMGMKGLKPKDMAEIKAWTGDIYYASKDEMGNPILQPGQKPIEFQPSTLDQAIERFALLWNNELQKVKDIIGVNDAVDASTPDKKALVGVREQAIQAHKASVRYLQTEYLEIMKEVADRAAYYQQLAIKEGIQTDEMRDLLSDPEFAVLEAKKIGELMYNIELELLPDAEEKQMLMGRIEVALQQGMIGVDDLLAIQRMMGESIEKAEEVFQLRVEKRKAEAQQQQQAQAQMEQQKELTKMQAEAQKEQAIYQMKMQLEELQKQLEAQNIREKGEEERKTLATEYELKKELVEKSAQVDAAYGFDKDKEVTAPKAAGNVEPATPRPDRITERL